MMVKLKNRKAQEEMVGFALIMIIVAVILLVFLGFSLRNSPKDTVESFEVESYIQSFLQYTSDCSDKTGDIYSIQDLILECDSLESCEDGRKTCEVLEDILIEISNSSWPIGSDRPVKGYEVNISSETQQIISISQGVRTFNSKGAFQEFVRKGNTIDIVFNVYY